MKKRSVKMMAMVMAMLVFLMGTMTGCGSNGTFSIEEASETVVMTIEDYDIMLDELNLYIIQYCYNNQIASDSVDDDTAASIIDSVIEEIKLEVTEYLVSGTMEDLEITESALSNAASSAASFYSYFGADLLATFGVSDDCVNTLFEHQVYIDAVTNRAVNELGEIYLEQYEEDYADLQFHHIYYAVFSTIEFDEDGEAVTDDDGNYVSISDSDKAAQLALAEEFQERAAAGILSGDENETMEALVEEYGISSVSGSDYIYDGAYTDEINAVIDAMSDGDVSEVVETSTGYSIIRMDTKYDSGYKEYTLNYMAYVNASQLLSTMQETWETQLGVGNIEPDEAVIAKIDVKKICETLEKAGAY